MADAISPTNPDNPKDKFGRVKVCVSFIPKIAILAEAVVMALGGRKYGPFNWREKPVKAETYLDAAFRHIALWEAGEDNDDESGVSHLAHARACCGILIDALAHEALIDDRVRSPGVITFIKSQIRAIEPEPEKFPNPRHPMPTPEDPLAQRTQPTRADRLAQLEQRMYPAAGRCVANNISDPDRYPG